MDYSCKNIRNMLPTYLDNMMNEMDAKTIEKHLNNCAACRQEYEFLKSILETASCLPEIEVSDSFNQALHKNLIDAKNKKRSLSLKNFSNIAVATLSTAAVIAISVVSLGNLNDKEITTPIEVETETEVVENTLEIVSDEEIIQTPEVAEDVITESEQLGEENAEVAIEKPKSKNPIAKIFSSIPNQTAKTNKKETHQVDFKTPMLKIKNEGLAQGQQNSSSQQTAEEKPQQNKATARIKMTMPKLENGVSIASAFEEAISAPIADAKPESAPQGSQTPSKGSGGGGGASSGGSGASNSANTPEKVKVTANVKVKDSDAELAKKILSEYEYADGEYALSNAEYKEVMGQLDAMGASITLSKEDKTERYEELSDSLESSGASQTTSSDSQIQNELNRIDDEASKKFVILD